MYLPKLLNLTLNIQKQPLKLVLRIHRIKQREHLTICLTMIGLSCRLQLGVYQHTQVMILKYRLYMDLQIHARRLLPMYSTCTNCMPIQCFMDMLLRYIISLR